MVNIRDEIQLMKMRKRKLSGREKDERAVRLLGKLREQLYSSNVSSARRAAFNLSWMQEDGLDILKEALFGDAARKTKSAAAYGLRRMHGRMKKMALEVLEQGTKHADAGTRQVSENALSLLSEKRQEKLPSEATGQVGKFEIREIPEKRRKKREIHRKGKGRRLQPGKGFSRGRKV